MMLTYFFGSLVVSILFSMMSSRIYIPMNDEIKYEIAKRQEKWN